MEPAPGAPIFPDDVDWKSINHELMYRILSLPAEVEGADNMIKFAANIAYPPDFEDSFIERKLQYSRLGLFAYKLSEDLSKKYKIRQKSYNDWNPVEEFKKEVPGVSVKPCQFFKGKLMKFFIFIASSSSHVHSEKGQTLWSKA